MDIGKGIGDGVVDFGKTIGDGVVDFGKTIGNGVVDAGKTVAGGIIDVGKTIGDGVGKAIDGIKDFGSKIGGAFGSIFGSKLALMSTSIQHVKLSKTLSFCVKSISCGSIYTDRTKS